ncbi:MAG: MFS transporter [Pseudomonadota bacterium]
MGYRNLMPAMDECHSIDSSPALRTWLLTFAVAVVGCNSLVLSPILTDVARDFVATPAQTARAIAGFGGMTALSAFFFARQIDRIGPWQVLVTGMTVAIMAIGASAAATSWPILALAQGVAGLGAGLVLPATYHMATSVSTGDTGPRVVGRVLAGWSLSMVLGVPAAALLTDLLGWRSVFLVLAALGLMLLVGFIAKLPRPTRHPDATHEGRLAPLKVPTVPVLLVTCFAFMIGFYGVYPFVGDHLRQSHGISATMAGMFVLTYGVGFGLASLAVGVVVRVGARRLFLAVLFAVAVTYALLIVATNALWSTLLLSALWGFGNHFGLNTLVMQLSRADPSRRGAILGLNSAVTYVASFVAASVFGEVYTEIGFAAICWMACLSLVCGALLVIVALPTRQNADRSLPGQGSA